MASQDELVKWLTWAWATIILFTTVMELLKNTEFSVAVDCMENRIHRLTMTVTDISVDKFSFCWGKFLRFYRLIVKIEGLLVLSCYKIECKLNLGTHIFLH